MHTINKFKSTFLQEFYLDPAGEIRRSTDGYLNRFRKGDLAKFFEGQEGYFYIQVPKQRTTVRRSHLVLLLNNVQVPDDKEVDHKDGNTSNDNFSNLRVVSGRANSCNRKMRTDNTSGYTGIRWSEYHQHYVIRKTIGNRRLSRSRKTLVEAIQVLDDLTQQDTDYSARHGK